MKRLSTKAHYSNILKYIYYWPSSRHKEIAENEGIRVSFLTEIMKELQQKGAVKKYYSGKAAFYELTIDGKKFVRTLICTDEDRPIPDYIGFLIA
ncbi:MAG: hypothetical protein Q4C84_15405, partial [Bacillota bacterium]|nr:hypothetical protein [Bacillota bacterium]